MKWLLRICLILLTTLLVVLIGVNVLLVYNARGLQHDSIDELPRNKVGLLLGTTKHNPKTGKTLVYYTERVKAAAKLYHAGKIDYVVASSDNGETRNAETLAEDLVVSGVPEQRIIIDRHGDRTFHSIVRCKTYIRSDSVTIITQGRHGKRALYLARHEGLDAIAYTARGDDLIFDIKVLYHEQAAMIRMLWDLLAEPPGFIFEHPPIN